ncbi:MAG: hypothetical protein ACFFCS_05510, partial [Candidatus Hodarchaeota archaeon]
PSDLVVRIEFEREGIILPPDARFMRREVDFALNLFNYEEIPVERVKATYKIKPRVIKNQPDMVEESLIDSSHTDCFNVKRYFTKGKVVIDKPEKILIGIITNGEGIIKVNEEEIQVKRGSRFLIPSAARVFTIIPSNRKFLDFFGCFPGRFYE